MDFQVIRGFMRELQARVRSGYTPVRNMTMQFAHYVDEAKYEKVGEETPFTPDMALPEGSVFLRGTVSVPKARDGYTPYLTMQIPGRTAILTINGEVYQGIDHNRDLVPLRPEWEGQELAISAVCFGARGFLDAFGIVEVNRAVQNFLYSLMLISEYYKLENNQKNPENVHIRAAVIGALDKALSLCRTDVSDEEFGKISEKMSAVLEEELSKIDDGDVRGLIHLVGHTHIDVAWHWQLKDTVRKCGHSFSNMLRLMDEFPDFTFSCSQMQLLSYTKEYYPELFEQIKARVTEGRWELIGPMWVESDCNVISGESVVRQILHGVSFMEKEFGKRCHIAWLPDTFGFQPNFPQILKKSGTPYFYTYKVNWQHQNRFPYSSFIWQGIDGSSVISAAPNNPGAYNGDVTPAQLRQTKDNNLLNGRVNDIIFPYGWGDGGGGPTREQFENAKRLADFPGLPKTKLTSAAKFFETLEAQKENLPTWFGELYIETHRGTLTSQGKVKRQNRMAEILLQNLEKLGVAAERNGAKPDWSKLKKSWELVLMLQFHDILPGSSINSVYTEDCEKHYDTAFRLAQEFLDEMFAGKRSRQARVVNFLSWMRDGIAEWTVDSDLLEAGDTVCTANGLPVPFAVENRGEKSVIRFMAQDVPSLGSKTYTLCKGEPKFTNLIEVSEKDGGFAVETPLISAFVDNKGRITRLYDKKAQRETLCGPANDMKLFLDGPSHEDAWNLYSDYREKELVDYPWTTTLELAEHSALRTVIRVHKQSKRCQIWQDIIFCAETKQVDFRTKVDWRERNKVLRVYFPLHIRAQNTAYEVGFGTFLRPTVTSNPYEVSKFEVCAHKFADLSEGDYGVAVLNDCKYGHDTVDTTIGLTLLRSTVHPDPTADQGEHEINYALYPHEGDWRMGQTARKGHEFNNPFLVLPEESVMFPSGASLVTCRNENIIVDTVKPAENGNGYVVRVYECNGNRGNATLSFPWQIQSVQETDLLEEEGVSVPFAGDALAFSFTPYEIKTFVVSF